MGGMGGMMGNMGNMGPTSGMDFMHGGMGMLSNNMMGMGNEAMFRAALQSSMQGQSNAQLLILLPVDLLQQILVPQGHLAEIAQKCGIRIDLGMELPNNMCQVAFTGPIASNAMAAYFLQNDLSTRWLVN